jgi:hypothetical protein
LPKPSGWSKRRCGNVEHRREFALRDPDGHPIIISEEADDPVTCVEE